MGGEYSTWLVLLLEFSEGWPYSVFWAVSLLVSVPAFFVFAMIGLLGFFTGFQTGSRLQDFSIGWSGAVASAALGWGWPMAIGMAYDLPDELTYRLVFGGAW